ncbi:MAG: lipocalin family protein [Gammaproteobacteria bacterium]|nr:lipocalin family protein [Gammaproteobacteria bacterium]
MPLPKLYHRPARLTALFLFVLGGCTGVPEGVDVVTGFDLDRYLGTWYEVARLDHRFERGLSDVTATYSLRDDGGVHVVNRGYSADSGAWDEATGKAYFISNNDIGRLKVSFFGPFYGGYNIIELDKDGYQYALVAGPERSYLWILSRSPTLDPNTLSALITKANDLGFATDELIFVEHTRADH